MKKSVLVCVLCVWGAIAFSQNIDLGKFPKGTWVDNNWNAVWEFGANSIKLYDTAGMLLYDFDGKIENLKIDVNLTNASVTFYCKETRRLYQFSKSLKDLNLDMKINPDWSDTDYSVALEFKK